MKNLMISFTGIDDHYQNMEVRKNGVYNVYKVERAGLPIRKLLRSALYVEITNLKNKWRKMWN